MQSLIATVIIGIAAGAWIGSRVFQQRLVRIVALFWSCAAVAAVAGGLGVVAASRSSPPLAWLASVLYFVGLLSATTLVSAAFQEVAEEPVSTLALRRRFAIVIPVALVIAVLSRLYAVREARADVNLTQGFFAPIVAMILVSSACAVYFAMASRGRVRNREVNRALVLGMILIASRPLQQVAIAGSWDGYPGRSQTMQVLSFALALLTMFAVAYTQLIAVLSMERTVLNNQAARLRIAENTAARQRRHETAGYLARGIGRNVAALVGSFEQVRLEIGAQPDRHAELAIIDAVQAKGQDLLSMLREPDIQAVDGHRLEIGTLVEVALPRVRRMLPSVDIRWTPSADLHHCECPPEEFSRAVMNLILYLSARPAHELSPEQETVVTVQLSSQRLSASLGLLSAGDYARLTMQGNAPQGPSGTLVNPFEGSTEALGGSRGDGGLASLRRFTRLLGGDAAAEFDTPSGRLTIHLWIPDSGRAPRISDDRPAAESVQ